MSTRTFIILVVVGVLVAVFLGLHTDSGRALHDRVRAAVHGG